MKRITIAVAFATLLSAVVESASAQTGSLYHRGARPVTFQSPETGQTNASNGAIPGGNPNVANGSMVPQQFVPQQFVPQQFAPNGQSVLPPGYGPNPNDPAYGLQSSLTYIPPTQSRTIKLHDLVTVRVDEASTSMMLGNATSRKTTSLDAVLTNWIKLVDIDTIKPAKQKDGDPRVTGSSNEVYRGDSLVRTSDSLTFNIATQVVDIKPNGLITLQGSKKITQNDNQVQVALIGSCRALDIDPNNTLLSRNLLDIEIKRIDDGHVRDGYSRGWLTKLYAKFKPF
jgi:flagellar L-ring protein FlgH